jgi:hypothetical protein
MAGFVVNIPNIEISTISDSPIYHRDNNDQGKLEAKKDIQDDEIDFLQQISMLNDVEGSRGGGGRQRQAGAAILLQ